MKSLRPFSRTLTSTVRPLSRSTFPRRFAPVPRPTTAALWKPSLSNAFLSRRFQSSDSKSPNQLSSGGSSKETFKEGEDEAQARWMNTPAYDLTFTCKPCKTRSTHRLSKQAYHHGAVLIKCPGCGNRHIMADHLGIFTDKGNGGTLEQILARFGENGNQINLTKGQLDGDLEIWDDGTITRREPKLEETVSEPESSSNQSTRAGSE